MRNVPWKSLLVLSVLTACKEEAKTEVEAASSATAQPSASAAPVVSAAPSASAAPETNRTDCPANSTGPGSFTKPCEATGTERLMDVKFKKMDDKGAPQFSITNKSKALTILYGKIVVYFYDKAGKQIEVKDETETPPKTRTYHTCSGNFFGGVMKPGENALLTFSCVSKKNVPEGTATVEADMEVVGFADATGKKVDYYWRNKDLAPKDRPKSK